MGNTHGIADMAKELQATTQDLLPACIVTTTWPTVPVPPSLTLAAFATAGYVRDGVDLVYCAQEAHTVVLTGGDGQYWVALSQDSWTTYASWNRTAGTQYLWRLSATRPPDVDGLLVAIQVTVSGGNITAVTPAPGVTRAEALRALSGLGTMAVQHANAVAITGGSGRFTDIVTARYVEVPNIPTGNDYVAFSSAMQAAGGTNRWFLLHSGNAPSLFGGTLKCLSYLGVQADPVAYAAVHVKHIKGNQHALLVEPSDTDTGPGNAILFQNLAGTAIGSIVTTATATAYNTSSDVRLKHAIATLTGALERVRALRPVQFRWNADDSPGVGFLAHELQVQIPEAVSGEPDAVNEDGSVRPQQVDHSRVVPWLTACCQELAAQVQALTARIQTLEEALGL